MLTTKARVRERLIDGIKVQVYDDAKELISNAAMQLSALLKEKPSATIGLATGGTFVDFYTHVAATHKEDGYSFGAAKSVNLDEYVGLNWEDPQSYHRYMLENFFSKVDIRKENAFVPNGNAEDIHAEAAAYDRRIQDLGGVDLQYLGVGVNGHIGFNEPHTPFDSRTHVVDLTGSTREANSRFFIARDVPKRAITKGIGTILEAKKIIVLAMGSSKAQIIKDMFEVGMTTRIPITALKMHPDVTLMLDKDAAALLTDL